MVHSMDWNKKILYEFSRAIVLKFQKLWFTITEMLFFFSDLEARCLKSSHWQGHTLYYWSREELSLSSSSLRCLLAILIILWLVVHHFSHMLILSLCVFTSSFFCIRLSVSKFLLFITTAVHIRFWPILILTWLPL